MLKKGQTGNIYIDSSDLELTFDNDTQAVGIRFKGLNIPKNATILKAYIQFKVNEVNSEATSLTIQGEASPNAAAFTNTARNVSSRSRTANAVTWTSRPLGNDGSKRYRSTDPEYSGYYPGNRQSVQLGFRKLAGNHHHWYWLAGSRIL